MLGHDKGKGDGDLPSSVNSSLVTFNFRVLIRGEIEREEERVDPNGRVKGLGESIAQLWHAHLHWLISNGD